MQTHMINNPDESARRAYWTRQMDDAFAFMQAIEAYPVRDCGEPLVGLQTAVQDEGVTVLFSALPHVQGLPRLCYLRQGLMANFLAAARAFNQRGWALKIEDAYRTPFMQKHLAIRPDLFARIHRQTVWELGGERPPVDLIRRRVAALVAMSPKTGTHVAGSAMDVSVVRLEDGAEVDRGAPYLELSEKTPMTTPFISEVARSHRAEITGLMAQRGFFHYPWEFWHFNQGDAYAEYLAQSGQPGRYGPVIFDPATGRQEEVQDSTRLLNPPEVMEAFVSSLSGLAFS